MTLAEVSYVVKVIENDKSARLDSIFGETI